jgi:Domain of unknown function (DUF4279)
MDQSLCSVSLAVFHPSLKADAIVSAVGLTPGRTRSVSEGRRDGAGRPLAGTYKESYCVFPLEPAPAGHLADVLERLVRHLERRFNASFPTADGCGRLQVWVYFYVTDISATVLDNRLLSRLHKLGVDLDICLSPYLPVAKEPTEADDPSQKRPARRKARTKLRRTGRR